MPVYQKPLKLDKFYDCSEPELDKKKVATYESLRADEGDEWVDAKIAAMKATVTQGEPVSDGLESLRAICTSANTLNDVTNKTRKSRSERIVDELNKPAPSLNADDLAMDPKERYTDPIDKQIRVLREHTVGLDWTKIRDVCHDGKAGEIGNILIDINVFAAIQEKIRASQEAAEPRVRKMREAKAKKAAAAAAAK